MKFSAQIGWVFIVLILNAKERVVTILNHKTTWKRKTAT